MPQVVVELPATGDPARFAVDATRTNAEQVARFLRDRWGIESVGFDRPIKLQFADDAFGAWSRGHNTFAFGPAGSLTNEASGSYLQVVAHEMMHQVTDDAHRASQLPNETFEGFADVLGVLAAHAIDPARRDPWNVLPGADLVSRYAYVARDLTRPPSRTMDELREHAAAQVVATPNKLTSDDAQGLPSYVAFRVAREVGEGPIADIWMHALRRWDDFATPRPRRDPAAPERYPDYVAAVVEQAAAVTLRAADDLRVAPQVRSALEDAWRSVGALGGETREPPAAEAGP